MKEALKLALEALTVLLYKWTPAYEEQEKGIYAITAIKEALAQPTSGDYALGYAEGFNDACKKPAQQEPVAWTVAGQVRDWSKDFSAYKTQHYVQPVYIFPPQPQQEPVAFFDPQGKNFYWAKPTKITAPVTVNVKPLPFYTNPPQPSEFALKHRIAELEGAVIGLEAQRTWVGLTDAERLFLHGHDSELDDLISVIEAKLKAKNAQKK